MNFLITGHTGFKGSWLTELLAQLGHTINGVSLNPKPKSLYLQAQMDRFLKNDLRVDIRNRTELFDAVSKINPEVIIHLAAQPLVRYSYSHLVETYETNLMGTLNLLEASRALESLKSILIITTDKVYKNVKKNEGYFESDCLGGDDPYSSSKACADLAAQSWRESFGRVPTSIARAGNVIGGGDWSEDRIIPDLVNALQSDSKIKIRNPNAIRPWQHVLDCLNGYLKLIDFQIKNSINEEWNFGPSDNEIRSVKDLYTEFSNKWGKHLQIEFENSRLKESEVLLLDSSKSRSKLSWSEKLKFEETVNWTVDWYKHRNPVEITSFQIRKFLEHV